MQYQTVEVVAKSRASLEALAARLVLGSRCISQASYG